MSRAAGYADFFPDRPSVLLEKERSARDYSPLHSPNSHTQSPNLHDDITRDFPMVNGLPPRPTSKPPAAPSSAMIPTPKTDEYDGEMSSASNPSSYPGSSNIPSSSSHINQASTLTPITPPQGTLSSPSINKPDSHLNNNTSGPSHSKDSRVAYPKPTLPTKNYKILYDPELDRASQKRNNGRPLYRFDGVDVS